MASLFRLNFSGDLWFNGGGLASLVNDTIGSLRLQQFPTAYAAVAMRADNAELVALNWGNAGLAVQAACAVEGRLAPVAIGSNLYLDADRVSPLPVRLARRLGAQRVLAIDASAHEDKAPPTASAYRASDLRKRELTQADALHADLVLHPEFGYYTGCQPRVPRAQHFSGLPADTATGTGAAAFA
jgi:NTE family protein